MKLRGSETDVFAGIDIGGTKVGVCIGRGDGHVLASERFSTDHSEAPEDALARALARVETLRAGSGHPTPAALGVACPGPITLDGRFLDPPNMPRWHGFDVAAFLRQRVDSPVTTLNDANAAVCAEWLWGAARGADTAVFCTMSTGMGAGLIVGKELHQGPRGFAGEIGHLRLRPDGPVGFGKAGSVEGFLSGPGMLQVARAEALRALQIGESTGLLGAAGPREDLDTEALCELARGGDPAARRATDRCAGELGALLAILVDLLDPDVVVLGTIGSAYPDLFLGGALDVLRHEALPHALRGLRVVVSGLQDRGSQQAIAAARYAGR